MYIVEEFAGVEGVVSELSNVFQLARTEICFLLAEAVGTKN